VKGLIATSRVVVVACGLSCSCAGASTPATTNPPTAADFQASIAELDKFEPNSPATLAARLEYADFLLDHGPGPCQQRLDLAQSLVATVITNPATQVVFPGGWGRPTDLQYRIHRGRAACVADAASRIHELQAAVDAARQAVQLYRDALDYRSMAVMQYNVGVTYQALGDGKDALAALEAAIQMDREFGLRADAQDNYALLLKWRKEPGGPDQVAQHMADFPSRSTTLKFAWSAGDVAIALDIRHASVVDGQVLHASGALSFERRIRVADGGWVVSLTPSAGQSDFGVWPRETAGPEGPLGTFRPALLQFPTIELTSSGDFKAADDLVAFAARVTKDAQTATRAQAPAGKRTPGLIADALRAVQVEFAPDVIANEVTEAYGLETAMWIGATLKQGGSYELTVPLSLPGLEYIIVEHQVDFTFTRELPCTSGPAARSCVELVLHATPLEQPLQAVLSSFQLPQGTTLHYASSISMRLIVDPQTLKPYLRDTRRYWYVTLGKEVPNNVQMESDRSESKLTYRE
jgi:tetratricopeptide (TPR) repeat protein